MDPITKLIDQFEKIKMKKYQYDDGKKIVLTNSMKKKYFYKEMDHNKEHHSITQMDSAY